MYLYVFICNVCTVPAVTWQHVNPKASNTFNKDQYWYMFIKLWKSLNRMKELPFFEWFIAIDYISTCSIIDVNITALVFPVNYHFQHIFSLFISRSCWFYINSLCKNIFCTSCLSLIDAGQWEQGVFVMMDHISITWGQEGEWMRQTVCDITDWGVVRAATPQCTEVRPRDPSHTKSFWFKPQKLDILLIFHKSVLTILF